MVHEEVAPEPTHDPEPTDGGSAGRHSSEAGARARAGRFAHLGVLVVGVLWGASASYEGSRGELFSSLVPIFAIGLTLAVAVVLAVASAVALALKRPGLGRWLGWAAPLVVAATILGVVGGPVVGYRYQPSVDEAGTLDLTLTGLGSAYVPHTAAIGDCTTLENSQAIGTVGAANLGTLKGYRVTASLDLGPAGTGDLSVDIGAESFPQGVMPPTWEGQASVAADSRDLAGSASFQLGQGPGPYKPGMPTPPAASVAGGWPTTLIGTLTWQCSGQPMPSSQSANSGSLSITAPGLPWTAPAAGSSATCSADGISGPIGTLQGYAFSASIDFRSSDVSIQMDLVRSMEPPLPNWNGQANLSMPGGDWHSGTASFAALPTGVDPSVGPPPAGWPPALTGTLTWSCGS